MSMKLSLWMIAKFIANTACDALIVVTVVLYNTIIDNNIHCTIEGIECRGYVNLMWPLYKTIFLNGTLLISINNVNC